MFAFTLIVGWLGKEMHFHLMIFILMESSHKVLIACTQIKN